MEFYEVEFYEVEFYEVAEKGQLLFCQLERNKKMKVPDFFHTGKGVWESEKNGYKFTIKLQSESHSSYGRKWSWEVYCKQGDIHTLLMGMRVAEGTEYDKEDALLQAGYAVAIQVVRNHDMKGGIVE